MHVENLSATAPTQMNSWEQKYHDITELFNLSDELLSTVETSANPEAQLDLLEPLVETIGESADVLSDEYIALCEGSPARRQAAKGRVEGALRRVYIAMQEFSNRAADAKNAAHAIVKKIKRQLEHVVSGFMEFLTLSLDRIMQKNDVDELKERHAHIALMLHQLGQGA